MTAYIGIGSNMGNRKKNIQRAIEFLSAKFDVTTISSIYETEPLYHIHQPLFLNCVVCLETASFRTGLKTCPYNLLTLTKEIEKKIGRTKGARFGPRLIDLDILFFDNLILRTEKLIIPHPEIAERKFVLLPLIEIAPDLVHPVLKKTVKELLSNPSIENQVVRRGSIY